MDNLSGWLPSAPSYDAGSQPQAAAARTGFPALRQAARSLPLRGNCLRLVDLGCGQGANSLAPVQLALQELRCRTARPIEVVHTDLEGNDFGATLRMARGYQGPAIFSAARAGSFYEPLFPPASVHLAWCATATHWLSRAPGPQPEAQRSGLAQAEARRLWSEQARQDWERWLACRAGELVKGGQVVVVGSGTDRFGRTGAEGLLRMVDDCLPAGLVLPTYHRRLEEWLAPLGGELELLEASEPPMAEPFWEAFQQSGDRQAYADSVVSFVLSSLAQAVLGPQARLLFVQRLRERVLARPEQARCRWWVIVLRLRRR